MMDQDVFEEAEQRARYAEQAFVFDAFDESLRLFELALKKDQGNERANAYLALLSPLKHLKGIRWRTGHTPFWQWAEIMDRDKTLENSIDRFFVTPYKTKISSSRKYQTDILRPLAHDILDAIRYLEVLKSNLGLDITLRLPNEFASYEALRIRHDDILTSIQAALGHSFFAEAESLYTADDLDEEIYAKVDSEDRLKEMLRDPLFGVLQDPEFFRTLKSRALDWYQGSEYALELLKIRLLSGKNDGRDPIQLSSVMTYCRQNGSCALDDLNFPMVLTRWGTPARKIFWDKSGNPLNAVLEERYEEFPDSEMEYQFLLRYARGFRATLMGPVKGHVLCLPDKIISFVPLESLPAFEKRKILGPWAWDEVHWVDLPTHLNNPVRDIKDLHPRYSSSERITTSDPTIHGLIPEGIDALCVPRKAKSVQRPVEQ